jgi:hypothetical protein
MNDSEMDRINYSAELEIGNIGNLHANKASSPQTNAEPPRKEAIKRATGFAYTKSQIRAILYKSISFQKRQIATNIFQILSPLICLFLIWLAQYEMKTLFKDDYSFNKIHGIPFFLNLPTSFFSQSAAYPISSSDCLKWFIYQDSRSPSSDNLDINDLMRPQFFEYCRRVEKLVPVFNQTDKDVNTEIFSVLNYLDQFPLSMGEEIEGLDRLPDAGIVFKDYTKNSLDVDIQINDLLFNEFHRNNGFSKMSFKMPSSGFNFFKELKDDYLNVNLDGKSLDNGIQRLTRYFTENNTSEIDGVNIDSQKLLNKTQSAFKRMINNRNTTFPVF